MYPCFCSDEELDAMRAAAEAANLPPVYNGRWARATAEQVEEEMAKGTPYCFRFRVPPNKTVVVRDLVRGDVTFNTDTLGDFVVMRSNGLPVRPSRGRDSSAPPCCTHRLDRPASQHPAGLLVCLNQDHTVCSHPHQAAAERARLFRRAHPCRLRHWQWLCRVDGSWVASVVPALG